MATGLFRKLQKRELKDGRRWAKKSAGVWLRLCGGFAAGKK
jgi:hypothetical protein